ncbi:MacB family efflux pump subunit [Comamonadaceae bacterium OH2545_COT-014]|nr:MacB family efflux pump subunit [Comamonadaceae bacterium OH2545_COT-014]
MIALRGITREFPAGDGVVAVLQDVNLRIHAGEMVAIVGPSGSGKSTLMNLIGCLDQPTRGSYRFAGQETQAMTPDELARLRREHFGFVFQRYQLLGGLSAQENVAMPAIYAGLGTAARRARSAALLARLGMQARLHHKPGQLSGGQQQRVSIARALMNGGSVVLADEPTGALDSATGEQVMRILQELNAAGHTVILVTHDAKVAAHARRIIQIEDGRITHDGAQPPATAALAATGPARPTATAEAGAGTAAGTEAGTAANTEASAEAGTATAAPALPPAARPGHGGGLAGGAARLREAARMAVRAMAAHRMRTLLTMLGIIIGIVSVALVNALGEGSKRQILADISALGTNTIDIFPGSDFGDLRASAVHSLQAADAQALAALPFVHSVTPTVQASVTARHGNREKSAAVQGVGAQFFAVRGERLAAGVAFDEDGVRRLALEAVINPHARRALFAPGEDPLGRIILLGQVPARVIGVTAPRQSTFGPSEGVQIWLPYTTVMGRLTGSQTLQAITVRVRDDAAMKQAEADITRLLRQRHGAKDFFTHNSDTFRATVEKTTLVLRLFISSIAVIALVVGGIGVMNIMLVSVTERTHEIGIRMAVGARRGDILQQFLIEAVFVCLLGGLLGIALALGLGWLIQQAVGQHVRLVFSPGAIALAVACASLIGLCFGFWPARNAARLNPVEALARP